MSSSRSELRRDARRFLFVVVFDLQLHVDARNGDAAQRFLKTVPINPASSDSAPASPSVSSAVRYFAIASACPAVPPRL